MGGRILLIASGIVLAIVGARILLPLTDARVAGRARRRPGVVVPAAAAIGVFTGLLANGGGFLLVPLFVVILGLTMPESAGTSLVVIAVLSVPTLVTHWALGHIDWVVAGAFAAGSYPGRNHRITPHRPHPRRSHAAQLRHLADRVRRLLRHPTDRPRLDRPTSR